MEKSFTILSVFTVRVKMGMNSMLLLTQEATFSMLFCSEMHFFRSNMKHVDEKLEY